MGRPASITIEDVTNIANDLVAKGVTPTVDAVLSAHGSGSKTTATDLLRKWKANQQPVASQKTDAPALTDAIAKAINSEIIRVRDEAASALNADLTTLNQQLNDVIKESTQREETIAVVNEELKASNDEVQRLNGVISAMEKQLTEMRERAQRAEKDLQEAKIQAATAEAYKTVIDTFKTQLVNVVKNGNDDK